LITGGTSRSKGFTRSCADGISDGKGAPSQARIKRVIFAAAEPKSGAAGSVCNLFADTRLNAHTAVFGGIMAEESRTLLQAFFRSRR